MIKNIDERIIAESFHTGHEVDVVTIQKSDYEHLKEQAERVQGLENHLKLYEFCYRQAYEQNKRYREVIKKAIDDLENECLWYALEALKALGVESE